jgi:uncharacterized protein YlaI
MSLEIIVGAVALGLIVFSFLGRLSPKSKPKEAHFKCARCGTVSRHTGRTIEAWRNNKIKFFCQSCHSKWVQTQPSQQRERFTSSKRSSSGCLGVVVLFTLMPLAGFLLLQAYA